MSRSTPSMKTDEPSRLTDHPIRRGSDDMQSSPRGQADHFSRSQLATSRRAVGVRELRIASAWDVAGISGCVQHFPVCVATRRANGCTQLAQAKAGRSVHRVYRIALIARL